MTSDKSETLSRPLHLPLSNEALSSVCSSEVTLLSASFDRGRCRGLDRVSDLSEVMEQGSG